MITTRILSSNEIEDACALLYDVYIEHEKWEFSENNPSQLRIEARGKRKILIDRFTNSAIWFGVFDKNKLVGCARLCRVDENNKFEIEAYPNSEVVHKYLERKNCVEMGKVAVKNDYRGQKIIHSLYLAALEYCETKQFSIFSCVHDTYIEALFHKIGILPKIEQAFKYEAQEQVAVNFYIINYKNNNFNTIYNNLKKRINNLSLSNISILDALERVVPFLPAPMYWHDVNGKVLGINEHCINGMDRTIEEVIGKTPYDFYSKEIADHIWKHSEQVIKSGEILTQEEYAHDIAYSL